MGPDIEFQLLTALTHPNDELGYAQVEELIDNSNIDWSRFVDLSKWHRLVPQCFRNLQKYKVRIPDSEWSQLHILAQQCQHQSLQHSMWLIKLSRLFDSHQIRFIALKGVALAHLLYSDITRRQAKDLDLMINKADLSVVENLLIGECGFARVSPGQDACDEELLYADLFKKDRVYVHERDGTIIELHWRFFYEQTLLSVPFSILYEQASLITIHQQRILFLGLEHLWCYQTMHGVYSGWYRLHWVTDIAAMINQKDADWNKLLVVSERLECKQSLLEGLVLAARVYGLTLPDSIIKEYKENWRLQFSVKMADRLLKQSRLPSAVDVFTRFLMWLSAKDSMLYTIRRIAQVSYAKPYHLRLNVAKKWMYSIFIRPISLVFRCVVVRVWQINPPFF